LLVFDIVFEGMVEPSSEIAGFYTLRLDKRSHYARDHPLKQTSEFTVGMTAVLHPSITAIFICILFGKAIVSSATSYSILNSGPSQRVQ
jgi:hypothetical protein